MRTNVIIEMAPDGGFWCRLEDSFKDFAIFGAGETVAEAKQNLSQAYEEAKEDLTSEGKAVPELEFDYHYDMKSFFNYFNFLNVSKVAQRAGINPSLMRRYTSGVATAGQSQYQKLSSAIRNMADEMIKAQF